MAKPATLLAFALILAAPAQASFEKGGLLEAGPRSAALGGATAADVRDAISARGSPAGLAFVGKEYIQGGGGGASQASLVNFSLGYGTAVDGIGLSALLRRTAFSGGGENALGLNAGLPVAELPWLALGAGLKWLQTDLSSDRATGFGFDAGVFVRPPLPWQPWTLALAAGVEDALGELKWNGGLREDLSSLGRLAAALRWAGALGFLAEIDFAGGALGRETIISAGCEYSTRLYGRSVELRMGVRDGTRRETAVGGGVGVAVDRYVFDYALVGMAESQGYLHLLSARMTLGTRYFPFGPGLFGAGEGFVKPETGVVRLSSPYQTMRFNISCPRARERIASWTVVVMDRQGQVVWNLEGQGRPVESVAWNCVTEEGEVAADGEYSVQLVLHGDSSFRYLSKAVWFRIERISEPEPEPPESGPFVQLPAPAEDAQAVLEEAKIPASLLSQPKVLPAAARPVAAPKQALPEGGSLLSELAVSPSPLDLARGGKLAIKFRLGRRSDVTVLVYDQDMSVRYRFVERRVQAGARTVEWDGRNDQGNQVQPGTYRVTVIATDGVNVASDTAAVVLADTERHG